MSLKFLDQTPVQAYRRLAEDLVRINPQIGLSRYQHMSGRALLEEIGALDRRIQMFPRDRTYGRWLRDPVFVEMKMLREALDHLYDARQTKAATETLVPGYTYYHRVRQFGPILTGYKCHYLGEDRRPGWVKFSQPLAVAKAMEIMRFGSDEDFRRIYIERADGCADRLQAVRLTHLMESSPEALRRIEAYCDQQWEGKWPWERAAPIKLREQIEEDRDMHRQSLAEMRGRFDRILREFEDGEMSKFEVVRRMQEMSDKIERMIQDLGRIRGEGLITLKDQARVAIGDQAADMIEKALTQPVRQAADIIRKLRAVLAHTIQKLADEPTGNRMEPDEMSPEGGEVDPTVRDGLDTGEEPADQMADVPLDGRHEERPKKAI